MTEAYEVVCSSTDRDKWLEARKSGIGASDAAALMGISPWRSPLELWAEKTGAVPAGNASEAAYWGSALEPLVLKRYSEETNRQALASGQMFRSVERPWQLATLDGVQVDPDKGSGVLEIKCTVLKDRWEDGPPDYVLCQVQHQLAVTGWQWASVAALFSGREFWWGDVERDEPFIEAMNTAEEDFWNMVLLGNEPLAQATYGDSATLQKLYPKQKPGTEVELGAEFVPLMARFEELKQQEKALKEALLACDNTIKQAIGSAELAKLPNGVTYSYKAQTRKEYVVAEQTYRVLRKLKETK